MEFLSQNNVIEIAIRPRDVQLANQIFRATWSGRKNSRNYSRMLYYSFYSATRSGSKDLIGLKFLILTVTLQKPFNSCKIVLSTLIFRCKRHEIGYEWWRNDFFSIKLWSRKAWNELKFRNSPPNSPKSEIRKNKTLVS